MSEQPTQEANYLEETELGLGAWAWGDRTFWHYGHGYNDDDIAAAFNTSLAAGVNFVDTAEIYGSGRSEILLGKFIKTTEAPVRVATKFFPIPYRLTNNSVVNALKRSLERLQLDKVDLYQLHWPSPVVPLDLYVEGLALAVEAGLASNVGISNYNKDQMQKSAKVLASHGIKLASNQVEYHLLDRQVEKNGLLQVCKEAGIRLIAYSPLAMGLLTGKYTRETPPPGPRGRKYAAVLKELAPLIALMIEIGKGHGSKTSGQVALNWIICKGALPIPGAKTAKQAQENAEACGWRLTPEEVQALDQASDQIG